MGLRVPLESETPLAGKNTETYTHKHGRCLSVTLTGLLSFSLEGRKRRSSKVDLINVEDKQNKTKEALSVSMGHLQTMWES